ncbi:hypothetical protein G6F58_012870 [Rhizopus delemar]|nr:hypothetical protein G6F58_012870 [Rhizopus delemar]
MLYLTDAQWNADRGNKPVATCDANCGERATEANNGQGGGSGGYPGNSNWVRTPDGNAGTFEVWGKRKGDMAPGPGTDRRPQQDRQDQQLAGLHGPAVDADRLAPVRPAG